MTKDISKVLKTSQKLAEGLGSSTMVKPYIASVGNEDFHVEVIGEVEPVEVTEKYLAEIIFGTYQNITSWSKSSKTLREDICWIFWWCCDYRWRRNPSWC